MTVCTKFYGKANSFYDISLQTTNLNLLVAQEQELQMYGTRTGPPKGPIHPIG